MPSKTKNISFIKLIFNLTEYGVYVGIYYFDKIYEQAVKKKVQ